MELIGAIDSNGDKTAIANIGRFFIEVKKHLNVVGGKHMYIVNAYSIEHYQGTIRRYYVSEIITGYKEACNFTKSLLERQAKTYE